jgi:phospholipase/lecithinase/hemolysin
MTIRSYLKSVALAIVLVLAAIAVRPAAADTRTEAFVFGDSLSDNGNFCALTRNVRTPASFY